MSCLTQATGYVRSSLDLRITNHWLSFKHCANYQTLFYVTKWADLAMIQACAEAPCWLQHLNIRNEYLEWEKDTCYLSSLEQCVEDQFLISYCKKYQSLSRSSAAQHLLFWTSRSTFPLFFPFYFFFPVYYKISGFHNFKKVDIARKKIASISLYWNVNISNIS